MPGLGSTLSKALLSSVSAIALVAALVTAPAVAQGGHGVVSKPFAGPKANKGTVTCVKQGEQFALTFSNDFVIPDTPAPHWQVVDSKGNVYLLQRLKIKEDKINKTILVPCYVKDIAKVQIWCAWAETLLGEAAFDAVQS